MDEIRSLIRTVPDFPKPGVLFRDITPLLARGGAFKKAVHTLLDPFRDRRIDLVTGPEARGFIFGTAAAYELGVGFVPIRRPGKLPFETRTLNYELEYGIDTLQVHADAIAPGQRVLIVDDVLATGGTMAACASLVESMGGVVEGCAFLIELEFLKGRRRLAKHNVHSVIRYAE